MASPPLRTLHLPTAHAYQRLSDRASLDERIALSYKRARAVADAYGSCCVLSRTVCLSDLSFPGLTAYDVQYLTPKFWDLHADNIHSYDAGAYTLLTIQYNLAGGTLAPFAEKRPELRPLMDKIMKFEVS